MRRITIWLAKPPGPDPSAQSVSGSQQGAVGATDRYSFHLTVTQTVELELRAQDADADLILLNDQDAAISESRNDGTANEAITKRLPAGSYAVAVQAQQAIANRFKLTYEAILNSEPHELGDLTEGQWDPLTGPVTDNNVGSASNRLDNYTFTLSEPKTLHLLVTGQEGDTDLYLEDEDGAHIAQSQNSGTTDEAITTTLTAGTWYLAIKPKTTGTNFAYSLRYGVTNPTTPESLLLIALANRASRGIWSNATTLWVADSADDKIYAYDLATGGRDPAQDIDTLDAAGNTRSRGIWSNGTTMWVADGGGDKIYAYDLAAGDRDAAKDIDSLYAASNNSPMGIWSDGTTMWTADGDDDMVYAYDLATGDRDAGKDIDTPDAAGNRDPRDTWSDGTTIWVVDGDDGKVYAYNLVDGSRDSARDIDTLAVAGINRPWGLWSDGVSMWIGNPPGTTSLAAACLPRQGLPSRRAAPATTIPSPPVVAVDTVPIVVSSTTDDYFVL